MENATAGPTEDRLLWDVTIAAPAAEVWDALRDPAKINRWFGWDADSLADEVEYIFVTHAEADEARRSIQFTGTPDRFEVVDQGATSRIRIVRAAPAGETWDGVFDDMTEGWISFVEQLRLGLEQHGLAERRTVFLSGAARQSGHSPTAALGLSSLYDAAPGAQQHFALAPGDTVDGVAWHKTPFQVGLTIPAWGDGLLIAMDAPATEKSHHGSGSVTLTTYGMSDADFTALETRWKTWWGQRFGQSTETCAS